MRIFGLAVLAGLALHSPAAAQDPFEVVPDLIDYGRVEGWRVGKLDSDDIWLGQACILFKELNDAANPVQVVYRFEQGEDTSIAFRRPRTESVPDPDAVDWGHLEPTNFIYGPDGAGAFEASGDIGFEYIDANTVYVALELDADAAAVDRIAAAEWMALAVDGAEAALRFDTGRATGAVARARRCLAEFD